MKIFTLGLCILLFFGGWVELELAAVLLIDLAVAHAFVRHAVRAPDPDELAGGVGQVPRPCIETHAWNVAKHTCDM